MLCGSAQCGSRLSRLGQVDDLSATPVGWGGFALSWTLTQQQPISALVAVYCDGVLQCLAPTGGVAALAGLSGGAHTLHAEVVGSTAPQRRWNLLAQRAWLRWLPETVPDLAAYTVQQQVNGTWTTVATITRSAVGELSYAGSLLSGSTGRLSIFGTVSEGTDLNGTITFYYDGTNLQLQHDNQVVESQPLVPRSTLIYGCGARVYVHDSLSQYVLDDYWCTTVGLACDWQSEVLSPGTYAYQVLASDTNGNPSTVGSSMSVVIPTLPEPATAPSFGYDDNYDGTYNLYITSDPLPSDGSTVRLYTNWNAVFGQWDDQIHTATSQDMNSGVIEMGGVPEGKVKVYLWTYKNGILRDERTVYTFDLPATPEQQGVSLAAVYTATLSYALDGRCTVGWTYDFQQGQNCVAFEIAMDVNNSTSPPWDYAYSCSVDENVASRFGSTVTYSMVGLSGGDGDTVTAWIRATDGNGRYGSVATISRTLDLTPPPAPTLVLAMPS